MPFIDTRLTNCKPLDVGHWSHSWQLRITKVLYLWLYICWHRFRSSFCICWTVPTLSRCYLNIWQFWSVLFYLALSAPTWINALTDTVRWMRGILSIQSVNKRKFRLHQPILPYADIGWCNWSFIAQLTTIIGSSNILVSNSTVVLMLCVAHRRRWRPDRGGRTRKLDPRGTDHCWDTVWTSAGAVLECRHQVVIRLHTTV